MESFCGDTEESTEDTEGRKKSKLRSLKSRLFGRSKKTVAERNAKLSQSASDITAGKGLGSDEDLVCSQGMMGSRALSHDSIFLADQELTDAEPTKVLSQENVHSKIKTLQMKLQQQKLHLGPPPLVLPVRHPGELGRRSETEGPPHNAPEIPETDITCQSVITKTMSLASSSPLSPVPKPVRTKSVPLTPPLPYPFVNPSSSSSVEPPVDFSSPAQFTPCLDTSAARHRMSVKPRNQRASTKKRLASTDSGTYSHTLNNISQPESVKEDNKQIGTRDEVMLEKEQIQTDTAVLLQLPCPEVAPITPKSPSITPQQENPPSGAAPSESSPVLRVRPRRPDVRERPHSAFMESELKDKRAVDFDTQLIPHNKRSGLIKMGKNEESSDQPSSTFGSVVGLRSAFHQQVQGDIEVTRGLKRSGQGTGSFHFSISTAKAKDGDRPRSGSFVEPLEQTEARKKATVGTDDELFPGTKEKEELRDLQPRDGGFALGRLKRDGSPPKSSELPWERRDSSKKIESVKTSQNMSTDTGPEDVDSSKEVVEEAVEAKQAQEEEGKTCTFGVKLRSTSQSIRFRADASSNRHSKPPVCEEQDDKQKQQEINNSVTSATKNLPTNTRGDVRLSDAAPSGSSFQGKNSTSSTGETHTMPTEVETKSANPRQAETSLAAPQGPQPAPQPASSEVSWMSLAMEKTRSLQQLFTSKFPRDFTAVQTSLRPQAQVQATNQPETQSGAQMQAQTVNKQPSTTPAQTANQPTDTAKAEAQSVKPAQTPVQQKVSPTTAGPSSREPHISKQVPEPQTVSPPPVQTSPWTSQSPLRSSTSTETSSQSTQGSAAQPVAQSSLPSGQHDTLQQPPWSHRGLHRTNQLRSSTSPATAPSPLPSLGKDEREVNIQEKEGLSLTGRRPIWGGSVSERAALLEKQAESAGTKGVELRKTQTEVLAPSDTPASTKSTAPSKDTKPEGREGGKPAESSPIKVPDRTRDDKWPRKNVTSSSPSSSPTQPSALQSMSENNQPSWMELAKRKSMAWNDRTMD